MDCVSDTLISAKFTSKNSNTFRIEHRLHNSLDSIFCYGRGFLHMTRTSQLILPKYPTLGNPYQFLNKRHNFSHQKCEFVFRFIQISMHGCVYISLIAFKSNFFLKISKKIRLFCDQVFLKDCLSVCLSVCLSKCLHLSFDDATVMIVVIMLCLYQTF